MADLGIQRRYARALWLSLKGDQARAQELRGSLENIIGLFELDTSAKVLRSPVMPLPLKRDLLKLALEKSGGSQILGQFLNMIVDSGRVALLPGIVQAFAELMDKQAGVVSASVESAAPLADAQLESIKALFGGKKVELSTETKEELLGGFVIRSGNSVIDMSLKTKLDNLVQQALA